MSIIDFKMPKIKFKNMKMNVEEELNNIDYEKIQRKNSKEKRNTPYEDMTHYKTVKEFFLNSVEKYPEEDCILEKPDHKTPYKITTYKEFKEDVFGLGTALTSVLNLKGKRVVIVGETQYGWYVSYMAMLCGVGIAVPTDRELPENELENIIRRSRASAVIYSPKKAEDIKKVKENIPEVEYFIEMKSDKPLEGKDVGINALISLGKNIIKTGNNSFAEIEIDPEKFRILFFTSGTTSNAKGVMLNNRNLAENINAVSAYVKLYPNDMLFSVLPLHHCYESTIGFLLPMAWGSSIAVCQGLKHIVPNMLESKPSVLISVPLLIENLYKKINASIKKAGKDGLVGSMLHITNALKVVGVDVKRKVFSDIYENLGGNLRFIVSAAAPIDAKIGKWVEDIGITFLQGYGLTETAPIAALTPEYQPKVGSAGKAIPKGEIRIEDPNEDGEGEVLIKTPTLMLGYYEDEKATNEVIEVIDGERWFHSGDIGYLDKDGFLYITGRSKNVIVTQNGKNIYPEEIELLLAQVPEIKECMVYGKQDEKDPSNKELIISVKVIPNLDKIGENLTDEEIREIIWPKIKEVNKKLTSYKAIKNLEIKHDEFEKTTTMKIKRYAEIKKSK